jgi:CRISPR-associated endoribonuclease Cas6
VRIILDLIPCTNYRPNFEYHHNIQRFVYKLLKNTSFQNLHDKKGYKFFSFSNIFKNNDLQQDRYKMIISSPSSRFIEQISYQLQKLRENNIPIEIGNIVFELIEYRIISNPNFQFPLRIVTGSPILIRIPLKKFNQQSDKRMPYQSVYWRASHPLQLFTEALEQNLRKKYTEFKNSKQEIITYFEIFKFKKQVSTKLQIGNSKIPIIGSLWEFIFSEYVDKEIQLFTLDCGLGERNSLGFGFLNPIIRNID